MRQNYFKAILLILVLTVFRDLNAQTLLTGSTAFPILSVSPGARAVGMGESFTAVADDLSAMHYNSAGLVQVKAPEISLMHNSYLDTGFFDTLGAAYSFGNSGTLALGLNYLNYGSIDRRDGSGNLVGSYTPFDISLRGAFGFSIDKDFSLGFSSQWIRQDINGSVHTGLLWDMGFLLNPAEHFSGGLSLKNLGVDSGGYNLPVELWAGTAYRFQLAKEEAHVLLLSLNGVLSFQGVSRLNTGLEYAIQRNYFLRAGYSQDLQPAGSGSLKGLDLGAGVKVSQFQLDYSFSLLGDLGNVHRVSLSVFFNQVEKKGLANGGEGKGSGNGIGASDKSGDNGALTSPDPSFQPPVISTTRPVLLKFQVKSQEDQTAQQLFDQAEEKSRLGLKQEALDLYLKAVEKDPHFQSAWMSLGKLYFDKSLESYRKVLEMDPKNVKLRDWLGHFKH